MKPLSGRVVCIFGLPASGKTTVIQSLIASSKELIAYISSGDIARKLSTEEDTAHMANGNLFPHEDKLREEIYNLIHKRRASGAEIIFIDGFPRFDQQVQWLVEQQFAGTVMEGCLIQIIGEDLAFRVGKRMRDHQDELDKFEKKLKDQSVKIFEMEKLIFKYGIPYYCIPNSDLSQAIKMLAKHTGIRK
jgi:adenylate kinase family enzyme